MTHHPSNVVQSNPSEQLAAAFHLFNQLSDDLGESYRELQRRVETLSNELAIERSKRFSDLALKEQLAHRLAGLLSCLPGGVIVLDRSDRVIDSNPEGKALLGDHCVGRLWSELLFENTSAVLPSSDLFKQSEVALLNERYISLSERVPDADGGGIVLVTDVTDAHHLRAQQLRQQRLTSLGEMTARMAHQLRTPLSTAILHMSHLSVTGLSTQARDEVHHKIQERLHHIEELIDGMLSYVRGSERTHSRVCTRRLLTDLVCIAESAAGQRGGRVTFDDSEALREPESIEVTGCKQEILSALTMLVENAVQVASEPMISISVVADKDWVDVFITDNGPGICASDVERVFEPFYSKRPGGTGLGLAIAQVTAAEHGGDLSLISSTANGSRFRFRLPNVFIAKRALDMNQKTEVEFCG